MKMQTVFQSVLVIAMVLLATTMFAQGGVGAALGGQTKTNTGVSVPPINAGGNASAGAGASAKAGATTNGGASVGAGTQTNAQANSNAQTKGVAGAAAKVGGTSSSDITTHIQSNPALMTKVQAMLPPRMSMDEAAAGFKSQGQFIAALQASNNLKIPFDQLHARMTGSNSVSLGTAIKQTRPDLDEKAINAEVKTAEKAAANIEKK